MSYIYEGMEWAHSYMYVWMSHVWMSLVCGMRNVTHIWNEQCHIYTCEEWGMSLIYEEWEKKNCDIYMRIGMWSVTHVYEEWGMSLIYEEWEKKKIVTYMEWGMWHIYVRNEECHSYMRNEKKKKLSHIYEDRNVECHTCIWGMRNVTHIWGMRNFTYIWGMRDVKRHTCIWGIEWGMSNVYETWGMSHVHVEWGMSLIYWLRNFTYIWGIGNVKNIWGKEWGMSHIYEKWGMSLIYWLRNFTHIWGMGNVKHIWGREWGMSHIYMRNEECHSYTWNEEWYAGRRTVFTAPLVLERFSKRNEFSKHKSQLYLYCGEES